MRDHDLMVMFTHHPPKGDQPQRYERLRAAAGELAQMYRDAAPQCRELDRAVEAVDDSVKHVNAAIARHER